jgi:UPF0755 protein
MKGLKITHATIIFLLIIAFGSTFYYLYRPLTFNNSPVSYTVSPGSGVLRIAYDLKKLGVIDSPQLFVIIVSIEGQQTKLQSGEYQFESGITSLQSIITKMKEGDVVTHELTIVDGWSFKQLMQVLNNQPDLKHELAGLTPAQVAQKLQLNAENPEGLFLPETYQFVGGDSDISILKRANKAMMVVLNAEWQTRTTGDIYTTPYQALIVASMIQKESGVPADQSKVSGVIYRRLQKNMRLQIDPTVIYAMGDAYTGKLHSKDLWVSSPYNTYRHRGLPPTPIAYPSDTALYAALHPEQGNELYFVAAGNGTHYFSSNLQTHDRAVIKYLLNGK